MILALVQLSGVRSLFYQMGIRQPCSPHPWLVTDSRVLAVCQGAVVALDESLDEDTVAAVRPIFVWSITGAAISPDGGLAVWQQYGEIVVFDRDLRVVTRFSPGRAGERPLGLFWSEGEWMAVSSGSVSSYAPSSGRLTREPIQTPEPPSTATQELVGAHLVNGALRLVYRRYPTDNEERQRRESRIEVTYLEATATGQARPLATFDVDSGRRQDGRSVPMAWWPLASSRVLDRHRDYSGFVTVTPEGFSVQTRSHLEAQDLADQGVAVELLKDKPSYCIQIYRLRSGANGFDTRCRRSPLQVDKDGFYLEFGGRTRRIPADDWARFVSNYEAYYGPDGNPRLIRKDFRRELRFDAELNLVSDRYLSLHPILHRASFDNYSTWIEVPAHLR
jgi:hypothetical protein